MSVRGCLAICSNTLNGIVAISDPSIAHSDTCIGFLVLAPISSSLPTNGLT
jgi:hypothetical protein